jgi:large subunit ribosomal protein L1
MTKIGLRKFEKSDL